MNTKRMTNTAELRDFLLSQMVGVADDRVNHDQARSICNLAQQVYNTLSTEIRMKRLATEPGGDMTLAPVEFGK